MKRILCFIFFTILFHVALHAIGKKTSEIVRGILHQHNNKNYIILHELSYHATKQSFDRGNLRSVGYNEMYLSVYSLETGRLLVQKNMGPLNSENKLVLLGCIDDHILAYSTHENSGMIALNINTLDTKVFFSNYMINRDYGSKMINTDWKTMYKHFAYNPFKNAIIFTDSLNKKHQTNINKYKVETSKFKAKIPTRRNYFESETEMGVNTLSFSQGEKHCISINGKVAKPNYCFSNGYFIMQNNSIEQFNYLYEHKENLEENKTKQVSKTEILKQSGNDYYKITQGVVDSLTKKITINKTKLENLLNGINSTEIILQTHKKDFFVAYKESDADDALLSISKLELENNVVLFQRWTKSINGMYYNIGRASNTKQFKHQFPTGLPESEYVQFEVFDDKILVIYLLQMCLLDVETGNIIWKMFL